MVFETKVLLAADTDRTQDYVFESNRLPEIRGASIHLDALNRWAGELIEREGGEVVFAGGGSLLALVPQTKADELIIQIETRYPSETGTATITAAWRPVTVDMLAKGYPDNAHAPFGSLMEWAGNWLRREKDSRIHTPWVESLPYVERCVSCRIRPANPEASFEDRPLCSICRRKREYASRDYWFEKFSAHLTEKHVMEAYLAGDSTKCESPQDLSEIGQVCKSRPGYIGMIYLDGDDMGSVFGSLATKEQARVLSECIRKAAETAVMDALAAKIKAAVVSPSGTRQEGLAGQIVQEQTRIHPFDILTIGGDDVLLVVPADVAIPVATDISLRFKDEMCALLSSREDLSGLAKKPFTLSGGVVIADHHNPVRTLWEMARDLTKEAKRSRPINAQEGYLDFVVLQGTDTPDRKIKRVRQLYPYLIVRPGHDKPLSLLGRPYAVSAIARAWVALTKLKAAPFHNSQMFMLAQELLAGKEQSNLFYRYQKRQQEKGFDFLDEAVGILQGNPGQVNPLPWINNPPTHRIAAYTVLWDLAELYSLV